MTTDNTLLSHPRDIAKFALECLSVGVRVALGFVAATQGGSVRMPGLRMAITEHRNTMGYVSNGCIEADVVATACEAIECGQAVTVAYGRGSGKLDLVLPCGGRVELIIVPLTQDHQPALELMQASDRRSGKISLSADGKIAWQSGDVISPEVGWEFPIVPKIRLHVIGSGSEATYLARLASVADMDVQLHSPDPDTLLQGREWGLSARPLNGMSSQPELDIDEVTAVALMFHDHEWETLVLREIITGPAFYIGALGSHRAHQNRVSALIKAGCMQSHIDRICAPIGIVQKLRDPNLLAASVVAEIASEFQQRYGSF